MLKNIVLTLVGVYFVLSGTSKMYPIEFFELQVYGVGLPWLFSVWTARVIIWFEILLGIGLVWPMFSAKAAKFSTILLVLFSVYLIHQILTGKGAEDCGCLGTWLSMNGYWALLRNFIFIGVLVWAKQEITSSKRKLQKWVFGLFALLSFVTIVIIHPPDYLMNYKNTAQLQYSDFPFDELPDFESDGQISPIPHKGKKVVVFFSTGCPLCRKANTKLHLLRQRSDIEIPLFVVFMGQSRDANDFWEQSGSPEQPHAFLPAKSFLPISGPNLPAIFLLDGVEVKSKMGYRDFDPDSVLKFFEVQ